MWQHLFLKKAIDCPIEHKAYCRLYHICFGGREQYEEWIELMQGREHLEEELENLDSEAAGLRAEEKKKQQEEAKMNEQQILESRTIDEREKEWTRKWLERELGAIKEAIRVRKEVAMVRGAVEANRFAEGENLYGDEEEPGIEKLILPQTPMIA
jgi:hypothetical protein